MARKPPSQPRAVACTWHRSLDPLEVLGEEVCPPRSPLTVGGRWMPGPPRTSCETLCIHRFLGALLRPPPVCPLFQHKGLLRGLRSSVRSRQAGQRPPSSPSASVGAGLRPPARRVTLESACPYPQPLGGLIGIVLNPSSNWDSASQQWSLALSMNKECPPFTQIFLVLALGFRRPLSVLVPVCVFTLKLQCY